MTDNKPREDAPPLLGEIAYLKSYCVRFPIIFTYDGWQLCRPPHEIDPAKIERDEVCRDPMLRGRTT